LVEDLANQIRRPERKAALLAKIERFKQKKTHEGVFAKMTEIVDGARRFKESPPLLTHHADATPEMMQVVLNNYLATMPPSHQRLINRYQIVDVVLKAVGVGSVGTTAGVILLRGDGGGEDSIFLQVKQASRSVLEQYVGMSSFAHCGERVVVGQRLLQSASDMFLGWTTGPRRKEYYVRQLMDAKGSVDVATLDEIALAHYAEVCGHALARAHARTGDPQMLAGYMGDGEVLDEAIAAFALTYAEQNRRDYQLLLQAIKKGEIVAAQG
jgi:uncharacterized protein (DUF2252 family)